MNTGILYGSTNARNKNSAVTVREWSDFKQFIDTDNVPAFVFWGNYGCSWCDNYIDNVIKSKEFIKFMAGDGRGFAYYQSESDQDVKPFVKGPMLQYPYVRLYWKKSNGNVVSKDISRGTSTYAIFPRTLIADMKSTFAGYKPKTICTLTYKANGGVGNVPGKQTVDKGTKITLSSKKLTKTGYTHIGWMIDGKVYKRGAEYKITESVTAKAAWEAKDTDPEPPSEPDRKEYVIPVFDPAQHNIKTKGETKGFTEADFPLYHQYKTLGTKYMRMSENVKTLCVKGENDNNIANQLHAAYLNKRITEVSPSCFMNCTQLTAVNADNNVKVVDDYAFYGCSALKGISFLGTENKSFARLGNYAFARSGLESITLNHKGSVDDSAMHSYCFASCLNLEQVEFTNSTYLGAHMFDGCRSLKNVILNNYHSYVSEYCFANCQSLTKIDLPAKTYMLSPHMFDGCSNLKKVNFALSADLRQCGDCAFSGCSKLTSITLPESVNSLTYIDPMFLSGSSINRVVCKGLDDSVFAEEYQEVKELKYSTNKWYWEPDDIKNIVKVADENNIPIVAGTGLPFCSFCQSTYGYSTYKDGSITVIDPSSINFKSDYYTFGCPSVAKYLKSKNCFWLFGRQSGKKMDETHWMSVNIMSYSMLSKQLKFTEWGAPTTIIHWKKKDGTVINKVYSGKQTPEYWISQLKNEIGSYSGSQTETKVRIRSTLTTFGRGTGLSVTYVSKTGNEYVCGNDKIEHIPETRVDKVATDDFRYGIWYYNAKQLKEYADEHCLPAMFEYSSSACDPCRDFRKQTFNNQTFQNEITKRPCLLCRVEIGENEYFDHPTDTQAYYLTHDLNKENTYIPCLIYRWKKYSGDVGEWNVAAEYGINDYAEYGGVTYVSLKSGNIGQQPGQSTGWWGTIQTAWNYNYRSDPANANYQTVLSKLDAMLGDYAGETQYWPPTSYWSSNQKFQYYENQDGDEDGRYFVCDQKTPVTKYVGELSIDLDNSEYSPTDGSVPSATVQKSSGTVLNKIETDGVVDIPPFTYQYYTTTGDDSQYNAKGVIFKVENVSKGKNTVSYIYEFLNDNTPIPDPDSQLQYAKGASYKVDSETGFKQILDECETNSILLVIYENGKDQTAFDTGVFNATKFRNWLRTSEYVIAEIRQDDWSSGVGQAVRQFETKTAFVGNSVSDPLPKLLVYHGCSSCTADGRLEVYCRRKIAVESGKDWKYYADLIDQYSKE